MSEKLEKLINYIRIESKGGGFSINKMKKDLRIHEIDGRYITRNFITNLAYKYKIPVIFVKKQKVAALVVVKHGYSQRMKHKCPCGICKLSFNLYNNSLKLNQRTPKSEGISKRKKLDIKTCDIIANKFGNLYETNRKETLRLIKLYRIENNIWADELTELISEEKIRIAGENFKKLKGKYPTCMSGYDCTGSLGRKSWRTIDDWMKRNKEVTLYEFFTGKKIVRRHDEH